MLKRITFAALAAVALVALLVPVALASHCWEQWIAGHWVYIGHWVYLPGHWHTFCSV